MRQPVPRLRRNTAPPAAAAAEGPPPRRLLATPDFVRLWAAGGLANAMRWLEILVAGLFTYAATGSALAVALVSMTRAVPMLLGGALAGALADSLDRRHLLMLGQGVSAAGAAIVAALAATGRLAVWHLALHGLASGLAWAGEMATRRRMVAEAAGARDVVPAVALDTLTGSATRMAGPMLGGLLFQLLGVAAAHALAAALHLAALALTSGVAHAQARREFALRRLAGEVAEAARAAAARPVLRAVLGVTVAMNVFGFSYTAVLPAFGSLAFAATPFEVGLLAAAEPAGALVAGLGIALGGRRFPLSAPVLLAGAGFFLLCLLLAALSPALWPALALLALGGVGTAVFSGLQTALAMVEAPPEARSRMLGLVTTCIGAGPAGVLAVGAVADLLDPAAAIALMACAGLVADALVWRLALSGRRGGTGGGAAAGED